MVKSPDRTIRKEAFETLLKTYYDYRTTYASLLSSSVQKDRFYASQRKYATDLDASLEPNSIPTTVYHNLIDTVDKNLPLLHRYMEIKRKALGPLCTDPGQPFSAFHL